MAFYDLPRPERDLLARDIHIALENDLTTGQTGNLLRYYADGDTYIRKTAYIATGRIYLANPDHQLSIIRTLQRVFGEEDPKVRQTAVNSAGEIGMHDFEGVVTFFDTGLFDPQHSVRNAVIGSMKKMGEKNPTPVLNWSRKYLHHPDKEVRREICHGIELRGRTHPEDVLPLLEELQFDKTRRVRWTLVHVIGQVAYKKGCLEKVLHTLQHWENKDLVRDALEEIIDVHHRYRNFSYYTQDEAREMVRGFDWDNPFV